MLSEGVLKWKCFAFSLGCRARARRRAEARSWGRRAAGFAQFAVLRLGLVLPILTRVGTLEKGFAGEYNAHEFVPWFSLSREGGGQIKSCILPVHNAVANA